MINDGDCHFHLIWLINLKCVTYAGSSKLNSHICTHTHTHTYNYMDHICLDMQAHEHAGFIECWMLESHDRFWFDSIRVVRVVHYECVCVCVWGSWNNCIVARRVGTCAFKVESGVIRDLNVEDCSVVNAYLWWQ